MPPTRAAISLCSQADVEALLSIVGKENRVDDVGNSVITATESGYIDTAIAWGSAKVLFYCWQRFAPTDLADSWLVNDWATICSCYFLSTRRGNPVPSSIFDLYKQAVDDLKMVHSGEYDIPFVASREQSVPAWSNVRVDVMQNLRRVRVERPISEKTKPPYQQHRDLLAEYLPEVF